MHSDENLQKPPIWPVSLRQKDAKNKENQQTVTEI